MKIQSDMSKFQIKDRDTLFTSLANLKRIEILLELEERQSRVIDLAKKIKITNSETSRHIKRLFKHGFIQKCNLEYTLTPLGKLVIPFVKPLYFISQFHDFFRTHDFDVLPDYILQNIHALEKSKEIIGSGKFIGELKRIIETSKQKCFIITDSLLPFSNEHIKADILVSDNWSQGMDIYNPKFLIKRIRTLSDINLNLIISDEREGIVSFSRNGSPDFDLGFYINDTAGLDYLMLIWSHFWDLGKDSS